MRRVELADRSRNKGRIRVTGERLPSLWMTNELVMTPVSASSLAGICGSQSQPHIRSLVGRCSPPISEMNCHMLYWRNVGAASPTRFPSVIPALHDIRYWLANLRRLDFTGITATLCWRSGFCFLPRRGSMWGLVPRFSSPLISISNINMHLNEIFTVHTA